MKRYSAGKGDMKPPDGTSTHVVSEVLADGRFLITGYVVADGLVTAFMDVYADCTMRDGKRVLHVTMPAKSEGGASIPLRT